MSYLAKLLYTDKFETRKLVFEGEDIPTERIFEEISSELEDITFADYIVFSTHKYLPEEKGFSLTKIETATWNGIHSALCAFFGKKFPGTKIVYT